MRCATRSPADDTPQQRRDLLLRGWPRGVRRRYDRAALELLDGTGLIDHPLVQEHTLMGFLSTSRGPWWYNTLEWDALAQDPALAALPEVEARLLRLAARLGAAATADPREALDAASPECASVVDAALARAAGHGGRVDIPLSPSRADAPLPQWPSRPRLSRSDERSPR